MTQSIISAVALPIPWQTVHDRFASRLRSSSGVPSARELPHPTILHGRPIYPLSDDPVIRGVMRKSTSTMLHTCTRCGHDGRLRRFDDQTGVMCASCFAALRLPSEIGALLDEAHQTDELAGTMVRAAWHVHELSPRVAAIIPSFLWRKTVLPCGSELPYVATPDLLAAERWLRGLSSLVESNAA